MNLEEVSNSNYETIIENPNIVDIRGHRWGNIQDFYRVLATSGIYTNSHLTVDAGASESDIYNLALDHQEQIRNSVGYQSMGNLPGYRLQDIKTEIINQLSSLGVNKAEMNESDFNTLFWKIYTVRISHLPPAYYQDRFGGGTDLKISATHLQKIIMAKPDAIFVIGEFPDGHCRGCEGNHCSIEFLGKESKDYEAMMQLKGFALKNNLPFRDLNKNFFPLPAIAIHAISYRKWLISQTK